MSKAIKLGMIGFGGRGIGILRDILVVRDTVEVVAVCDVYEDRAQQACDVVTKAGKSAPKMYLDYKDVIADADVDTVIITASWENHINIACECMEAGKPVGVEVGGAYSIDDCWKLVRTYERTKTKCMLLENCCYGRYELLTTNMVRKGLFGEIVHCSGGYCHDLRHEVAFGRENRHYRLRNYLNRNCENYPTHELGPIAKLLGINDGNRMVSLTSTSSKAAGLHDYIARNEKADKSLLDRTVNQGDIVTTVIKCAGGETIVLTLDTTLPRAYSRGFTVRGTRGMYEECNNSIFLEQDTTEADHFDWKKNWGNAEKYLAEHEHPIWKDYLENGVIGGHDGIDWLVYGAFIDAILNGYDFPIDVYDMAAWMAITALSEESIACGSKPVAIPDFTNGMWLSRNKNLNSYYEI
ncbi:MAG: Gfo/Idh/MocA family oxidoreductase [Clostridia bacterium]|nr:Gfo/Idh/MocA family oxidoreductase [Clostridia bacterium]